MKIVSWNCNGAFRRKYAQIDELQADVVIIQECENPASIGGDYEIWADQYAWAGGNKNKGFAVFAKNGHAITPLDWSSEGLMQFLPVRINDEFDILAVWTKQNPKTAFRYIGQFWKYLQLNKLKLSTSSLICGDFNSNKIWDKRGRVWNHTECVKELDDSGFISLYHIVANEPQGSESRPTIFLHRNPLKPYHIDYAFAHRDRIPNDWSGLVIGEPSHWLQFSDHMPVIVSF
jgi:exonuclease III